MAGRLKLESCSEVLLKKIFKLQALGLLKNIPAKAAAKPTPPHKVTNAI
jgi:hypothetical protein